MKRVGAVLCFLLLSLSACKRGNEAAAGGAGDPDPQDKVAAADEKKPLHEQRGNSNFHSGNNAHTLIIKAPADTVADALMKGNPTKVIEKDLEKELSLKEKSYLLLQLKGQDWTIIQRLSKSAVPLEKLGPSMAAYLKTKVVEYGYSSFSDYCKYRMWDGNQLVESLDQLDPSDAKDLAGATSDPEDKKLYEAIIAGGGAAFSSSLRQLEPDDKKDGNRFVDRAMRAEDAFLPDLMDETGEAGQKIPADLVDVDKSEFAAILVVMADNK